MQCELLCFAWFCTGYMSIEETFLSFFLGSFRPARPFWGVKIIFFFLDGRYLNSTLLSGWGVVNSICVQLNHAHSYKNAAEPGYVYIFIVYQYMESTCTVVCAEFVPWVFVLHFMPKDLHFACVHTVYRVRQRILTAYHYRTLSLFSSARPSTLVTMYWREQKILP